MMSAAQKQARLLDVAGALELRPVTSLEEERQMQVLHIRNQPGIRTNMYTSHEISRQEHIAWVERLRQTQSTQFFAVIFENEIVGGVGLSAINTQNQRADWAYYLSETVQGKGIGSALEFKFLDFSFHEAGLNKLNCEVFAFNDKVIALHKKFGFQQEGVRRNHIMREHKSHDVVLLGITKDEWMQRRDELMKGCG